MPNVQGDDGTYKGGLIMGTNKGDSTAKKKSAEKKYCNSLTWIYKRLTWETTLTEEQVTKKFGKEISDRLKAGIDNTEICKEIRDRLLAK